MIPETTMNSLPSAPRVLVFPILCIRIRHRKSKKRQMAEAEAIVSPVVVGVVVGVFGVIVVVGSVITAVDVVVANVVFDFVGD